jgi:hypothetical protein
MENERKRERERERPVCQPSALGEALKGGFWQFPWQASVELGFRMLGKSKSISLFTELERLFPLSLDCLVPADTGSQTLSFQGLRGF